MTFHAVSAGQAVTFFVLGAIASGINAVAGGGSLIPPGVAGRGAQVGDPPRLANPACAQGSPSESPENAGLWAPELAGPPHVNRQRA